ncbi:serine/threonine protein kinase [Myxococcota bacterium]|nr:serine/threonine protein kinase [Myxococcota bacterium]
MAQPGERVGQYELLEPIGAGGSASVWRARHTLLGSEHAVKLLQAPSAEVASRLLREGRVQARLRHPNIVPVTDLVQSEERVGLVMEYIAGGTLLERLQRGGAMPPDEALRVFAGMLAGLKVAHQAGVLHRDLKPANVLMDEGRPRIADFGLARVTETTPDPKLTREGFAMGTPGYMAPEQWADPTRIDERADLFAMGVMLYELLTCRSPFTGATAAEVLQNTVVGRYEDLRTLNPSLDLRLVQAVDACLRPHREERVASAEALERLLGLHESGAPKGPPTPTPTPQQPTPSPTLAPPVEDHSPRAASTLGLAELRSEAESPQDDAATPEEREPTPSEGGPWGLIAMVAIGIFGLGLLGLSRLREPEAPEEPLPEPVVEAPAAPAAAPEPEPPPTGEGAPCSAEAEELGYWYAARSVGGRTGQVVTLPADARVRKMWPKTPDAPKDIVCTLPAGTSVRLQAPVEDVRGNRWIPLRGADLKP